LWRHSTALFSFGGERTLVDELAATNERVYRGWLLVDQLRAVYQAEDAEQATLLLDEWLRAALASLLVPFIRVARTLAEHRDGIVNAIALGLSNARLEAMNLTVRLISHRSRGFPPPRVPARDDPPRLRQGPRRPTHMNAARATFKPASGGQY
jgi:Transposase